MPRVHCPEERSKAVELANYQRTSDLMGERLKMCFAQLFLLFQLSIYGAISDLREEYEACYVRRVRPVLVGQYDPLFVPTSLLMRTFALSTDDLAQEDLLQKYQERAERLSQKKSEIKICSDAGFLTTVGVGQYFMTKDTEKFLQFRETVACREYTK